MFTKYFAGVVLVIFLSVGLTASVSAQSSTTNNCWGVVSSQFAQTGQMGTHSSSQSEPRLGLGNDSRLFFELGFIGSPHVSALGAFLATLDDVPQTQCSL